jgi:hypothetical protein
MLEEEFIFRRNDTDLPKTYEEMPILKDEEMGHQEK